MATSGSSTEKVNEYQCLKKIGKGSYGEVYLVRKRRDRKQFVMKNIRLSSSNAKERYAAVQEAELLSQLKHPNIVSYQESYQDDEGVLHIIMGYCEGGDLCTRLKTLNGTLMNEDKVVEWFVQIALALQYLHERKILHRDLKTQNIFLSKHDIIKVGDLGIARVLEGSLDLAHTVVGTPYYMSPELFANKPYDFKSDVWALGCCLYEMATLNHAFSAKNISALMYKILQGKVPPLPSCFSDNLNDLVCKMLSLDAKLRPSVYQILRLDFIRVHIKQFLDKASLVKRRKSSSKLTDEAQPTANELASKQQKKSHPPAKAHSRVELHKPIQLTIEQQQKPSPELSSAREKRRRSKQDKVKIVPPSRGSPSSLSVNKNQDEPDGGVGVEGEHRGEQRGEKERGEDKQSNNNDDEEEKQILTLMDNTLHQPLTDKGGDGGDEGQPGNIPIVNTQMEAIKRHCVSCIGEDGLKRALTLLESDTTDETTLEEQLKDVITDHHELIVMLQKLRLYLKTS